MTNHWNDIANSDCMMMIGSNPAENHPAAFGWILEAKAKGAKLISLDPRFTRSSAKADIYAHLRSGTDVALIGGMIKYVLDDMDQNPQNYNMTYVSEYTNASFLINADFRGPVDLDGIFSGYDSANREYDKSTWTYQLDAQGIPRKDKTLKELGFNVTSREKSSLSQVDRSGSPEQVFDREVEALGKDWVKEATNAGTQIKDEYKNMSPEVGWALTNLDAVRAQLGDDYKSWPPDMQEYVQVLAEKIRKSRRES